MKHIKDNEPSFGLGLKGKTFISLSVLLLFSLAIMGTTVYLQGARLAKDKAREAAPSLPSGYR